MRRPDLRHAGRGLFKAPETGPWLETYHSAYENWVAEDRRKLLAFARDMLDSDHAGHRLAFQLFAHLAAVYRNFDWDEPLDFIKKSAHLSDRVMEPKARPSGDGAVPAWFSNQEARIAAE